MGWKLINGHRYYYRNERVGPRAEGRFRSTYFGSGEEGLAAARLDVEARAERGRRRAERERAEEEDREISGWFGRVQALAEASLRAAGFHQHHGQWRRKKMSVVDTCESVDISGVASGPELPGRDDGRARAGAIRALLDDPSFGPTVRLEAGDPACWFLRALIKQGSRKRKHPLVKEAMAEEFERIRAELEGPNPTPIEKLLAERAAICRLQVYLLEYFHRDPEGPIPVVEFHQRRIERAHRRLLSAVRTLAQVRKLALPALQVNIARNQVNVSHTEG